jgi:hypothetical protein
MPAFASLVTRMLPPNPARSAGVNLVMLLFAKFAENIAPFELPKLHGFGGMTRTLSAPGQARTLVLTTPVLEIAMTWPVSSSAAQIWPPKGPKPSGTTAGPSSSWPGGTIPTGVTTPAGFMRDTWPVSHVTIMS